MATIIGCCDTKMTNEFATEVCIYITRASKSWLCRWPPARYGESELAEPLNVFTLELYEP